MLAVIVFIVAYHKNFILTKTIQDLSFQGDSNEPNEFDSIQPIKPIRNRLVSKNGNKEIINRNLPIESDSPNMFRSLLMGFGYCFIGLALVIIGIGYIVWNRSHNDTTTEDYSEYSDPNHKRRNEKGNKEKKKRKKKKRKDDTNDRESSNKSIFLWMSSDESDRNRNFNENNNKNGRRNERKRSSNHRRKKHDNKSEWDESETTFDEQSCPSSDTNENSSRQSATLSRRTMTRRANRKRYYSERARKNSRSEPSPDYTDCVNSSVTNTSTTTPSGTTIINTTNTPLSRTTYIPNTDTESSQTKDSRSMDDNEGRKPVVYVLNPQTVEIDDRNPIGNHQLYIEPIGKKSSSSPPPIPPITTDQQQLLNPKPKSILRNSFCSFNQSPSPDSIEELNKQNLSNDDQRRQRKRNHQKPFSLKRVSFSRKLEVRFIK